MKDFRKSQRSRHGLAVVFLAALFGVSCGGAMPKASLSAPSTGGNKDGSLSLNKSSLDFGNVQLGSSKSSSLTLTNSSASGGPSVTFSQVATSGAGFGDTTASLPVVLAPGQTTTIAVMFAPKAAGAVNGSLYITVDGAADPANVPLTGTGLGPAQLGVSPSTLSFGTVAVGSSLNEAGTLTAGSSDVTVTSAAWSGQGYSVSGISFPVTVPAGKNVSFTVTFAPGAAGASAGSVSFVSTASNSPTTEKLSGTGSQTGSQTPAVQHTVDLAWAPSSSSVTGYFTYRGSQSGGPYSKLNSSPSTDTSYSDSTVQSGQTYYYVVTSLGTDWWRALSRTRQPLWCRVLRRGGKNYKVRPTRFLRRQLSSRRRLRNSCWSSVTKLQRTSRPSPRLRRQAQAIGGWASWGRENWFRRIQSVPASKEMEDPSVSTTASRIDSSSPRRQ